MAAISAASLKPPRRRRKVKACARLAEKVLCRYIARVNRLTKQEILVLSVVIGLLLTGWAVKYYRTAHPLAATVQTAKP